MATFAKYKRIISNFTLKAHGQNQGYDKILIQLFGFTGHGKSSFINTCKYVLEDGEFQICTDAATSYGGGTTCRLSYPLTDTMVLVDNRGCKFMNDYESAVIYAQLGNLLPLDETVDWHKEYSQFIDKIINGERVVKSSDFIYPVFVFSVKAGLPRGQEEDIKQLLTNAKELTGIFPFVVLTNKSSGNVAALEAKFKQFGAKKCFALENFTMEDHMQTRGRCEDVLCFFLEVIEDIKGHLESLKDPKKQREKQKTFVLRFIHEIEVRNNAQSNPQTLQVSNTVLEELQKKTENIRIQVQLRNELCQKLEEKKKIAKIKNKF